MSIRSVAVYLGSTNVQNPVFGRSVEELAIYLAEHGMTLVFGGSNVGNMKILADTMLAHGGKAVGVFTKTLPASLIRRDLDEVVIAENLAERKAEMLRRADAVIALPGSFGTWDELFDALGLVKIGTRKKLVAGVLNVDGYFDHLLAFIARSVAEGYTPAAFASLLKAAPTPDELFALLQE